MTGIYLTELQSYPDAAVYGNKKKEITMENQVLYEMLSGTGYRGFHMKETYFVEELQCEAWHLTHIGGAEIFCLNTDSEEKTFSLSFRLSPEDHTGVAHIIEHGILSGSQKYKVKNWGGDGLLCSFNGAFTTRDASMYPVASKNEKSFQQLVRIYMDAVFAPLMLKSDMVMRQEGWHYEYDPETDALSYSGVVYSEMQSNYQIPDFVLSTAQVRAACRDTGLYYDIGGDPEFIPQLSYEHFLNAYDRFFVPENCLAVICGETCLSAVLDTMDDYWSDYEPKGIHVEISGRPSCQTKKPYVERYAVHTEGAVENMDFVGANWLTGQDRKSILAAQVLAHLCAPLLSAKLSSYNLTLEAQGDNLYPMLTATLRGVDASEYDALQGELQDAVKEILDEGFSEHQIQAALAAAEFQENEKIGFIPVGVAQALKVTTAWVHHQQPWTMLEYNRFFSEWRKENPVQYFTEFAHRIFLDNPYYTTFILKADEKLSDKRKAAEKEKLKEIRDALSKEELRRIIEEADALHQYQQVPDDLQAVRNLPRTEICDLEQQAQIRYPQVKEGILFYPASGNLVQVSLNYGIDSPDVETLHLLGILHMLFGNLPAGNMKLTELREQISLYTSGLSFVPAVYDRKGSALVMGQIRFSCLPEHFEQVQDLIRVLTGNTCYDNPEKVRQLLQKELSAAQSAMPEMKPRLRSYYSSCGAAQQAFGGKELDYYIEHLLEDFDRNYPSMMKKLTQMTSRLFDESKLTVCLSSRESMVDDLIEKLQFSSDVSLPSSCSVKVLSAGELFRIGGTMQYTAAGGYAGCCTGPLLAACKLAKSFAIPHIRDMGGAYRVDVLLSRQGDLIFSSARDPHLAKTFEAYEQLPALIRKASDDQTKQAVITAAAEFSEPVSFGEEVYLSGDTCDWAFANFFSDFTPQIQQELWEQLLAASPDEIRKCADILEQILSKGLRCAAASAEKAEKDGNWFQCIKV